MDRKHILKNIENICSEMEDEQLEKLLRRLLWSEMPKVVRRNDDNSTDVVTPKVVEMNRAPYVPPAQDMTATEVLERMREIGRGNAIMTDDEIREYAFNISGELGMTLSTVTFSEDPEPIVTFTFAYSDFDRKIEIAAKSLTRNLITSFFERGRATW